MKKVITILSISFAYLLGLHTNDITTHILTAKCANLCEELNEKYTDMIFDEKRIIDEGYCFVGGIAWKVHLVGDPEIKLIGDEW